MRIKIPALTLLVLVLAILLAWIVVKNNPGILRTTAAEPTAAKDNPAIIQTNAVEPGSASARLEPSREGILLPFDRMQAVIEVGEEGKTGDGGAYSMRLISKRPLLCEPGLEDVYDVQSDTVNLFGDNPEGEVNALLNAGAMYLCLGNYPEAAKRFQSANRVARNSGLAMGTASSLYNIGVVREYSNEFQAALQSFEETLDLWPNSAAGIMGRGMALGNIGLINANNGRYEEALQQYEEALAVWNSIDNHSGEANTLYQMGFLYALLGQDDSAQKYFQQSLDIETEVRDWTVFGNLGLLQQSLGQYDQAMENYETIYVLAESFSDTERESISLNNMGVALYQLGNLTDAQAKYNAALTLARQRNDRRGEATIRYNLGLIHLAQEQYPEAKEEFNAALAIASEIMEPSLRSRIEGILGFLSEQQGQSEEAVSFYRQAIDTLESVGNRLSVGQLRTTFAAKSAWIYEHLVSLLHDRGEDAEAFEYSERGRARAFLDSMENFLPELNQPEDSALAQQERDLSNDLARLENDLNHARSTPPGERSEEAILSLEDELTSKQQVYESLLARIQLASPELASLIAVPTTTVAETQSMLDGQTTLISYYLTEEDVLAFILTKSDFRVVELPSTPDQVTRAVEDFRNIGLANLANPHPRSLTTLYTDLVTPLLPRISTARVGIIPHQALHYIPFAALYDGERYFGEQVTLFTLPSASVLPFLQAKTGRTFIDPLVMGDPQTGNPALPRLAFAEQEAKDVAALLNTDPLLASEASEAALRAESGDAGVIHLAVHGSFNTTAPLFSRLWLAPGGGQDGSLNVFEVYDLDLDQTSLVVLSACQTQVGSINTGDDVVGLTRAFLYGAPTVVSSLWPVDDEATGALMTRFYAHLQDGLPKADALREAQQDIRADALHPKWAHPYYWAAFVLSGDGN